MDNTLLLQKILTLANDAGFTVSEKRGGYLLKRVLAERRAFLSHKKLVYRVKFRLDEESRELEFSETLIETGFGLSTADSDSSLGTGFKKHKYKTGTGPREGTLEEKSKLFGKTYNYKFDFAAFRNAVEVATKGEGYAFIWKYFL